MKKNLLFILLLSFISFFGFAEKIDLKKVETVAENFLSERNKQSSLIQLNLVFEKQNKNNEVLYYIYNIKPHGFVIISGDDAIYPVLAYSFKYSYNENDVKPDAFTEWLNSTEKQINETKEKKTKADKKTFDAWTYYSDPNFTSSKNIKDVSPLITSTWNQGCGYNSLCPEDASGPCGHVVTGCVATAMAQVINYHEWPITGEGSHSYTHYNYGELSADFGSTTYDWSNMPDGSGNDEISKLIYHCGVSVDMGYSASSSGAYSSDAAFALKAYFKYSKNLLLTSKYAYTDENWNNLIKSEIDAGRPLYYHGYGSYGGHAFNVDGYQGSYHFHLNWGWGGSYNGYYYLDDLTPGGYSFNNSQGAIVGVQPKDTYTGLDCSSPVILTANVPYYGTTTGSSNNVNLYANISYHETGKEVIHQITTSWPGRIRASVTDQNGKNFDVFILSDCNRDSLIAYGDSIAVADNTAPRTYLIAVDGRYAYEGTYTLTVNIPNEKPDLIIANQIVAPNFIEASGSGYVSFDIKNIGNSAAAGSKAKIYYSDDAQLDGSDIFIDEINIPSLTAGEKYGVETNIAIPAAASEGIKHIILVADANNDVTETDENYNTAYTQFNVPSPGIMNCTNSVSLTDNVWYFGNTETDGEANIDNYSWGTFPDKEVIHQITPSHNGIADIYFTKKIPGFLNMLVLSSCNENSCINNLSVWNPTDTVAQASMRVYSGVTYYFVVDGAEDISGAYGVKVKLPGACPEPEIYSSGSTDLCTGQDIYLSVDWSYKNIQWYKDNNLLSGDTLSYLPVSESGSYKVEVTENECSGFSDAVQVRVNTPPTNADITAAGDTIFCEGNNVGLNLATGGGYSIQWLRNGQVIEGETGLSYIADQSGKYSAKVTNISCSIYSDEKQVTVHPVTANIGEKARVNSTDLVSFFSLDYNDNTDLSGNGNDCSVYAFDFPEDRHENWNKAVYFDGTGNYAATTNTFNNPNIFTVSFWMKTNTSSGGMILGLGDNQTSPSTTCDRMIYMDESGKMSFGVYDGAAETISTTESYNDNNWHLITAGLSGSGMQLYVDADLKAEDASVTSGTNMTGWWRIAYDETDILFPNLPANMYFQGILDEIRIYERSLLPREINYLFDENSIFDGAAEQSDLCEGETTNIALQNTENFIQYQLRNDLDDSPVGSAVTGNADTISLPSGTLTGSTTFNISATNPANGCSLELSDLYTITVHDLPTAELSGGETICEGETTDLTLNLTGSAPWNIDYSDGTNGHQITTSDNPYILSVSDAGTYSLTALTDAYCTGTVFTGNAVVSVNTLPSVYIGEDTTITANDTLTLDAGAGFISYSWSDNSTNQTLTLIGSELGAGVHEYNVTVENENGCENSDTIFVELEGSSFVNTEKQRNISVYPNPARNRVFIDGLNSAKISRIIINDVSGRIIQEIVLKAQKSEIHFDYQPSGIYFIKIINDQNEFYFKIFKQ